MIPAFVDSNSQFCLHSPGSNTFNASRNVVEGNRISNCFAKLLAYAVISAHGFEYVCSPWIS